MEDEGTNSPRVSYAERIFDTVRTNTLNVHQTLWDPPRPDIEQERLRLLASSAGDDEGATRPQNPGKPLTVMVFVKLFITLAPMLVIFFLFPLLIGTGVDPLAFSLLALFLVTGLIALVILVC